MCTGEEKHGKLTANEVKAALGLMANRLEADIASHGVILYRLTSAA